MTDVKSILGLIAVTLMILGVPVAHYFYPYYTESDRCYGDGAYGTWINATEIKFHDSTFPAIGRYYCDREASISLADCHGLDKLVNVKGCKWGGRTSASKKTLYVMEDPIIEDPERTDYVKHIYTYNGLTEPYTIYDVCNPTALDYAIDSPSKFGIYFGGSTEALEDWGIKKGTNISKILPTFAKVCNPYYEEELGNGSIPYVQNCSTVQSGQYVKEIWRYDDFEPIGNSLDSGECMRIKVWGKMNPRRKIDQATDNIVSYAGINFTEYDWWNQSCLTRRGVSVIPAVTDANFQLQLNFSTHIDFAYAYIIRNDTNAELPWANFTGDFAYANRSVVANVNADAEVYYNCTSLTLQYNLTQVMVYAQEFDSKEQVAEFTINAIKTGNGRFNGTYWQRGIGSITANDSAFVRNTQLQGLTSNVSVIQYVSLSDLTTVTIGTVEFGTGAHSLGLYTPTSTVNYSYYAGGSWTATTLPMTANKFSRMRRHLNNTENGYIENTRVYSVARQANSTMWGFQDSARLGDSFDSYHIFADYDEHNPSYTVGPIEISNTPPTINSIECSNGTGNFTYFDWKDTIKSCWMNCTDPEGDNLHVNLSMYSGIASCDVIDSNDTQFLNVTNKSYDGFLYGFGVLNIPVNESGQWNVIGDCYDGNIVTEAVHANISWAVNFGNVNATLVTPVSNFSEQNGTTFQVTARCGCTGGECCNTTCFLDPP